MKICWEVYFEEEFYDDIIDEICNTVNREGKQDDDDYIRSLIIDEVSGWDDEVYYNWGRKQTDEVLKEIKRKLGGVQMTMKDLPSFPTLWWEDSVWKK